MKKNQLVYALIILMFSSCNQSYPKQDFKKGELFYTENVSKEEVSKAGAFLEEMSYFTDERKTSILLDKNADTFYIQIVVDKRYHTDTSYDESFKALANLAELSIFDGKKTIVELSDRNLNVKRRVN